jgi:hypothetical protein
MKIISLFYLVTLNFFLVTNFGCKPNTPEPAAIIKINNGTTGDGKIKGYFDADNLEDYIVLDRGKSEKVSLTIFINNGKSYTKKSTFDITNDDFESVENPLQNLFISNPKKGEILVGASCCGSMKTMESCYYKFFGDISTWVLYKITTATVASDFIPEIDVVYQDFTYSVDGKSRNNKTLREKELKQLKAGNQAMLENLYNKYKTAADNKKISSLDGNLNFDDLAELLANVPLTKENVNKYNDLAYYLSLSKSGDMASIFLLKKIIAKEPSRIVAYLNLADAQWDAEHYENAKENYAKYNSLMRANAKDVTKIPARVKERMK